MARVIYLTNIIFSSFEVQYRKRFTHQQGDYMFAVRFTALVLFLLSVFTPVPYPDPCGDGARATPPTSDMPCWED